MIFGILIGLFAAAVIFVFAVKRTKAKNSDPLQKKIADELNDVMDGFWELAENVKEERAIRFEELMKSYAQQNISMRQIAHSVTMLNLRIKAEEMALLRRWTGDYAKSGKVKL